MLLLEEKKNGEKKGKCLDDHNTFYMGIAEIALAPRPLWIFRIHLSRSRSREVDELN